MTEPAEPSLNVMSLGIAACSLASLHQHQHRKRTDTVELVARLECVRISRVSEIKTDNTRLQKTDTLQSTALIPSGTHTLYPSITFIEY